MLNCLEIGWNWEESQRISCSHFPLNSTTTTRNKATRLYCTYTHRWLTYHSPADFNGTTLTAICRQTEPHPQTIVAIHVTAHQHIHGQECNDQGNRCAVIHYQYSYFNTQHCANISLVPQQPVDQDKKSCILQPERKISAKLVQT